MKFSVTVATWSLALFLPVQASRSPAQIKGFHRQAVRAHAAKLASIPRVEEATVTRRGYNNKSSTISFANPAAKGTHALCGSIHVIDWRLMFRQSTTFRATRCLTSTLMLETRGLVCIVTMSSGSCAGIHVSSYQD